MHKEGKWAGRILDMQNEEGRWGWFHSLSQRSDKPITTEQALRRLERLGYTVEDPCIQKALTYMDDCLNGEKEMPDGKEKVSDWNVFSSLILAANIRRFTSENAAANRVAEQWAAVITRAFASGVYDHQAYEAAYRGILKPRYGRINRFETFYPVSLLVGCLDERTECAMTEHLLAYERGIYYICERRLSDLPSDFASIEASRYLAAIELLAPYRYARHKLQFVADWLIENKNEKGKWDMGASVRDGIYFPLSDDWRKKTRREADCTERIEKLLLAITE